MGFIKFVVGVCDTDGFANDNILGAATLENSPLVFELTHFGTLILHQFCLHSYRKDMGAKLHSSFFISLSVGVAVNNSSSSYITALLNIIQLHAEFASVKSYFIC